MTRVEPTLTDMVSEVLAATHPEVVLLGHMARLETTNENELSCALFESVFWRIPIRNYWTLYRAATSYRILGRHDASFLLSAMCHTMGPHISGEFLVCRDMYDFFRVRENPRAAIDVFNDHARRFPEKTIAPSWQVSRLFAAAGLPQTDVAHDSRLPVSDSLRTNIPVIAQSTQEPWACEIYGGLPMYALNFLSERRIRPAVNVACLQNAVMLIKNDSFVVCDAAGRTQEDLSVPDFTVLLRQHLDDVWERGGPMESIEIDEAVIIGDRFPGPPNLSHFLLDHTTRLAIYQRAGVDISKVTVIDAEPTAAFQKDILAACGVSRFLHTGRVARVQIGRLWVSSNCRELCHPAHVGSGWAIEYLRKTLGTGSQASHRRLYISRNDAATRRITNEEEVLELLGRYDFSVILPGQLPFKEQAAAFAEASHVVGPHGAGLTNIAVCQPGTHILEIFHPLYGTGSYAALADQGQLRYAAMVGRDGHSSAPELNDPERVDMSRNAWGRRDIRVDIAELQKWLDRTTGA